MLSVKHPPLLQGPPSSTRLSAKQIPAPQGRGPDEREAVGIQTAALAVFAIIREQVQGTTPIVLRATDRHTTCVAGMHPLSSSDLGDRLRRAWRTAATERPIFLAGYTRQGSHMWWGDRAQCLADQCKTATWGTQPRGWPSKPLPRLRGSLPNGDPDECPGCLEAFSDLLPRPCPPGQHNYSRVPDSFHGCPQNASHATCVSCDDAMLQHHRHRCCICRRPRAPWAIP